MSSPVGADEIAAVIARPDRNERNQGVTEIYHRLAVALHDRLGGRPDLTWCAFATWASATAGTMIAMRELPALFRNLLAGDGGYQKHFPHVRHVLDETAFFRAAEVVARQISDALSDGNTLVFAELAPAFVALLDGRPLPADPAAGTDHPLDEPFARYRRALACPDPIRSAQDILAANVLAVHHEQQRLQPYITAALDASLLDVFHQLTEHGLTGRIVRDLEPHLAPLLEAVDDAWDRALTKYATTLMTPNVVYHLGRDVPPLADGTLFPPPLLELADPDPFEIVDRFDRSHGSLVGSAAGDWAVLEDRMNYIVNLFRSRQHDASLLLPPVSTIDRPDGPATRTPDGRPPG